VSEIEVFQFPATGHEVRMMLLDGEPWFVARDVCAVLGISNGRDAVSRLDEDGVGTADVIDSMGRSQRASVVSEPGLYELIFQSRKVEAKAFRRWVTNDVLPTIRRTGRYEVAAVVGKPMSELEMAERYVAALQREQQLKAELETAAPKARSWDVLASGAGDYSVADAAKVLSRDPAIKLGQGRLFTLLGQWGWVYRQRGDDRWRPYQSAVETGRLSELPASHYHPRTAELVIDPPQVRVTTKGLHELHRRLGGTQPLTIQPELEEASR
jgi:prophage antirepressor-like protein